MSVEMVNSSKPLSTTAVTAKSTAVGRRIYVAALVLSMGFFILLPILALVVWAFAGEWYYPALLPQQWSLFWWEQVFQNPLFIHEIMLSLTFAPVVTLVSAAICLPAAYAFARYEFPGKKILQVSIFATNAFPKMGLYIAIAGLFYSFHLMGTFVGVVIVQVLNTLVVMTWIPTAAFASVPRALEEAARDVGAGPWVTFWKVTLPLARPGIIVACIMAFLSSMDEAQATQLIGAPHYVTMAVEMYTMVQGFPQQASAVFSILLILPSLVLLLLIRKYVVGGHLAAGYGKL